MKRYILTYGIACVEVKQDRLEVIRSVPDVTTDHKVAQRIVDLCNRNRLSEEHLSDVVEDQLNA